MPFSKIALLLWSVQFISAIVFSSARFQDQFRLATWNGVWVIPSVKTNNDRLSSIYGKLDLLETRHGTYQCLSIGRDCRCTEGIPRGNTLVVISKFEIGSFVRVDRSRKSTTRQSCEIKIVGSSRCPEAISSSQVNKTRSIYFATKKILDMSLFQI